MKIPQFNFIVQVMPLALLKERDKRVRFKMKKLLLFLIIYSSSLIANGQVTLYGTACGGAGAPVNLFSIVPSTDKVSIFAKLAGPQRFPANGVVTAPLHTNNGNFYVVTDTANSKGSDSSSILSISCQREITGQDVDTLASNVGGDVEIYAGNLIIEGLDSNLFGMFSESTNYPQGAIYKRTQGGYLKLLNGFAMTSPNIETYGSLIQTPDSTLWGMTTYGGTYNCGRIFKCTTRGVLTIMFNFDTLDGMNPLGSLCLASDGDLYGLAQLGGVHGDGTVFRITQTGTFTKLFDFDSINGGYPTSTLIQATDGKLYGTTSDEGKYFFGTLFSCTLSGSLTTLHFFDTNEGISTGALLQASDGYLYGFLTNYNGIWDSLGAIFQCSTTGNCKIIYAFNDSVGNYPYYGQLIEVDKLCTESVQEINNDSIPKIKLYPNPNNGIFTLNIPYLINEDVIVIEIFNLLGQEVFNKPLTALSRSGGNATSFFQINLTNQPSGVYLLRVILPDGTPVAPIKFLLDK